ncbi:TPA: hypothetical protein ACH3X3_006257 [Trebouxia sp. C0006]
MSRNTLQEAKIAILLSVAAVERMLLHTNSSHSRPAAWCMLHIGCTLLVHVGATWLRVQGTRKEVALKSLIPAMALLPGALLLLALACLFMAPILHSMWTSWLWAMQLSSSTLVPVAAAAALSEFPAAAAQRMLINIRPYGPEETAAAFQAFLSLLATWMGALPMPLDWGKDWQEWPIGCSAGGAYGNILGLTVIVCYAVVMHSSRNPCKHNSS